MKKYLSIISLLVVAVIALRITFSEHALHEIWKRESFWLKKANAEGTYDLVAIGDSRTYYALDTSALVKDKSAGHLNFAFPSMSFTDHYLTKANSLLKTGSVVIIGLTAESLTLFETDKSLTNYEKDGPLFFHMGLALIRTYWPQIELQHWLKWGKLPWGIILPAPLHEIYHDTGWIESNVPVVKEADGMLSHYKKMTKTYKIDEGIVNGLVDQAKKWNAMGISLYFFWNCFHEAICNTEKVILSDELRSSIEEKLKSSGAHLLNVPGTYLTYDGDHLTGSEALRFSKDFAIELSKKR